MFLRDVHKFSFTMVILLLNRWGRSSKLSFPSVSLSFIIIQLGRVVITSSVRGLSSWPTVSAYNMTKHGLETMADCLRLEMRKFGVNVSVIEPGQFDNATSCNTEIHVSTN